MTRSSPKKGFTLVEVMVGMVVFSIGILGSLGLLAWINRANSFNTHMVEASNHAQSKLEELQELGYDSAASGTSVTGGYSMAWNVSGATGSVRSIGLTVDWDSIDGMTHSMSYGSMVMTTETVPIIPTWASP